MVLEHLKELSQRLCQAARTGALNQSLLFVGCEGIGKFSLVMDIAMTLLCDEDMSACGECAYCREVAHLAHPDFLLAFPFPNLRPESKKLTVFQFSDPVSSAARFSEDTSEAVEQFRQMKLANPFAIPNFEKKENIPVEVVKDLIHSLAKKPLRKDRRVVAILDIDKMAYGAADLFLKTVEEPPQNTHLLLTTSRPNLLYPTLLSRTQRIKVPPVPEEKVREMVEKELGLEKNQALYLARLSGGSPGIAVRLKEREIFSRRERIASLFKRLLTGERLNPLVNDVHVLYSSPKFKYDDIATDFDIIETLIHDLYLASQNRLDNHLINVDIKQELLAIPAPPREVLDIWSNCCAETRRACTVNNVSSEAGMIFFYISCAEALKSQARPKFTLP